MTIRCLILGHAWHNDQGWITHIRYDEPCERRDCPATRNPRPYGVTSPLVIDVSAFDRPLQRAADQIKVAMRGLAKAANSPAGQRVLRAARHQRDIEQIQAIAAMERRAALGYLDRHMDDLYAELGLQRYPDIPF